MTDISRVVDIDNPNSGRWICRRSLDVLQRCLCRNIFIGFWFIFLIFLHYINGFSAMVGGVSRGKRAVSWLDFRRLTTVFTEEGIVYACI